MGLVQRSAWASMGDTCLSIVVRPIYWQLKGRRRGHAKQRPGVGRLQRGRMRALRDMREMTTRGVTDQQS